MSTVASSPPQEPGNTQTEAALESGEARKSRAPGYDKTPGRFHFMLRRLHSAVGLVFGGYITVHLLVNSTGLSPRTYQQNVDKIHSLEPMLPFIELATIFIPLLIHALYGVYITKAGVKFNTTKYKYGGNIRYALQRWTAIILLLFIGFHVGTLHKWGFAGVHDVIESMHPMPVPLPKDADGRFDPTKLDVLQRVSMWCSDHGGQFQAHNQAFQTTASGMRNYFYNSEDPTAEHLSFANFSVMSFYLLGIWSATFHFANGLWTSAIAWGLTVTRASQKRWGHVCLTFGILLTIVGTVAWYAFTFAPAARGDVSRWDPVTHTLPEEDQTHEADQSSIQKTPQ